MTERTEKLRADIRAGSVSSDKTRTEWEYAVAYVYEVERREEALAEMVRVSEEMGLYD